MKLICATLICAGFTAGLCSADTATQKFDRQLKNTESEFVSLVEAMPADKMDFAPTQGAFTGVRTFAAQAKHAAAVLNVVAAAMLGEAPDKDENGPASVKSKEEIVKYVRAAFEHAHRAIATMNAQNLMQETADPFDPKSKTTRVESAGIFFWHTFDHYGQMVEYARMNGVVPPASR